MSKLLDDVVGELSRLPGIGRRTALRLSLHLLRMDAEEVVRMAQSMSDFRTRIRYCARCNNLSDEELCPICSDPSRDRSVICVVEQVGDVLSIENTRQHNGLYHALGGVISPIDGIGPGDLQIDSLVERVKAGGIGEVILALSTTMEGDTTNFYIYRKLEPLGVKLSVIARGIAVGDELEYADEVTLGRSIVNRTPFSGTI